MTMSFSYQLEYQIGFPSATDLNRFSVRTNDETLLDRVAAINLRDLISDVFRSLHLRSDANAAAFRMELECNWIVWFPQRLRCILETLVSNSVLSRSHCLGGSRVSVYFRRLYPGYELRVTDNAAEADSPNSEGKQDDLTGRRDNELKVVRMLLAESDGELVIQGDKGHGSMSIAKLPVYCLGDFLEESLPA